MTTAESNRAFEQWRQLAPKPPVLADGERWHVFLSYRSVNRTWVLHLYDAFKMLGFEVFLDQLEIPAGSSLAGKLNKALDTSRSGVIVWSTSYADSEWCLAEFDTMEAMQKEKRGFHFVVAKLQDAKLPPTVRRAVFCDFTDYPDGPQGGELLRLMYGVLGKALPPEALRAAQALDDATKDAAARIQAAREIGNVAELESLAAADGMAWQTSPLLYSTAAEALIALKRYDSALAMLELAGRRFERAIRPVQLKALALARKAQLEGGRSSDASLGEAERSAARQQSEKLLMEAQQLLAQLYRKDHRDPETLGIFARTWMDRYELTKERAYLEKSRDLYALALKLTETDYYTGINAAAKSVFLGELEAAAGYAKAVEALVGVETIPGDYWKSATVAECQLIQRNFDKAAVLYRKAVIDAPTSTGSHDSTRGQAQRLLQHLQPPPGAAEQILTAFRLGGV
jgi:hypothetical protein